MAFIRKFKTASGATGVQVCWKQNGEVVKTVHVGSANSELGLKKLLKKAQKIKDEGKRSLFDLSDYDNWFFVKKIFLRCARFKCSKKPPKVGRNYYFLILRRNLLIGRSIL